MPFPCRVPSVLHRRDEPDLNSCAFSCTSGPMSRSGSTSRGSDSSRGSAPHRYLDTAGIRQSQDVMPARTRTRIEGTFSSTERSASATNAALRCGTIALSAPVHRCPGQLCLTTPGRAAILKALTVQIYVGADRVERALAVSLQYRLPTSLALQALPEG